MSCSSLSAKATNDYLLIQSVCLLLRWDFTGRTLGMLWAIDYKNPLSNREQWTDCSGRTMMSTIMIADKSEKLDRMSASPGYDSTVEFGPEIERFAAGMRSGFPA